MLALLRDVVPGFALNDLTLDTGAGPTVENVTNLGLDIRLGDTPAGQTLILELRGSPPFTTFRVPEPVFVGNRLIESIKLRSSTSSFERATLYEITDPFTSYDDFVVSADGRLASITPRTDLIERVTSELFVFEFVSRFNGTSGDDEFSFGALPDFESLSYAAGAGNDTVRADNNFVLVFGGEGDDLIIAGTSALNMQGGAGADTLIGGRFDDGFEGGDGDDDLIGDDGADGLFGGRGADQLSGGRGSDTLSGHGGRDALSGDQGKDTLRGGGQNDTLEGGRGRDLLFGDRGRDDLSGGAGRDSLEGGKGGDTLLGGAGADRFQFSRGDGNNVISDFGDGRDKLVILGGASGFDELTINQVGDDVAVVFANVRILLEDFDIDSLSPRDILFG